VAEIPHGFIGLAMALAVGVALGMLGGGGSILALPIFLYVFRVPTKPAVAMSLVVVAMSAFTGFVSHWRQGMVLVRTALSFGVLAMLGAFVTARLARFVPDRVQLGLFVAFAAGAALLMVRSSLRPSPTNTDVPAGEARFSPLLGAEAIGVGMLTSLVGVGGGVVIVPALVLLAHIPVRQAIGTSLLIITMNALAGFAGYVGTVPINWTLVAAFTGLAAVGALIGTRVARYIPQARLKQGFAVLILIVITVVVADTLGWIG
jgi:uncharacterized membrane protein YfcA